jgi:hypothetical protein
MRSLILAILLMCSLGSAQAQETPPDLNGYVTSVTAKTDFAVDGIHVVCVAKTRYGTTAGSGGAEIPWTTGPYIGQPLKVFGKKDHKANTLIAREIVIQYESKSAKAGSGMIDRVLSTDTAHSNQIVVRADGYPILINGKTKISFIPPLTSLSDVTTNVWIEFKGERQPDGLIAAAHAVFTQNAVGGGEGKLRGKNEYDPDKVDPKQKQGVVSKAMLGIKAKRIPPYPDPVTQARIDRIGASLVPNYQRALPATDLTKIDFRFQLIDEPWSVTYDLPSGIVLVPIHLVDRLHNDAQVAAILADAMASILEKRDYRDQPTMYAMEAAGWATQAGGFFVPGLGLAGLGGNTVAFSTMERHNQEQSGRVSLGLLQDAKYDIYQAPLAWWLLASKKPKDLAEINIPERARYLYEILGTTWRTGQMAVQ